MSLVRTLDRVNRRHPWSHNSWFSGWVCRQLKRAGAQTVLDVGCGTGDLLVRLAEVADHVTGLEPDPATAALAARRCAGLPGVEVLALPFEERPSGQWDAVTLVASLHHLPLESTLAELRHMLTPGGVLVVVGLARDVGDDRTRAAASLLLNPVVGLLRHPSPADTMPAAMTAPVAEPAEGFERIASVMRRTLPGVRLRRRLFWRYTALWRAPDRIG